MATKPDCYECKHRRDVPGSAHSSCAHPAFASAHNDPLSELLAIFASVGRANPVNVANAGCKVVGHPHGIRNGWFSHPFNFDPVWLQECDGFASNKAISKDAAAGVTTDRVSGPDEAPPK